MERSRQVPTARRSSIVKIASLPTVWFTDPKRARDRLNRHPFRAPVLADDKALGQAVMVLRTTGR